MKKSRLEADPEKVREFQQRAKRNGKLKRAAVSPASPMQRLKVKGQPCIACGNDGVVHPAHLIDRSLCPERADDPMAVVPLCPSDHRDYDAGRLDLLPHLEPYWRLELGFAVERFGLISTLERVTNVRWTADVMQQGFEGAR